MKTNHSSHAAGRAAYAGSSSAQEAAASTSSDKTDSSTEPQDPSLRQTSESELTVREQKMIEENFPQDPELSMRLYGPGRGTTTVGGTAVGENIDVVG